MMTAGLVVSPAYAGIGPGRERMADLQRSFPRVCGDRPD